MGMKFQSYEQYYMKLRIGTARPYFAPQESDVGFYSLRMKLADLGEELSLQRLLDKVMLDRTRV